MTIKEERWLRARADEMHVAPDPGGLPALFPGDRGEELDPADADVGIVPAGHLEGKPLGSGVFDGDVAGDPGAGARRGSVVLRSDNYLLARLDSGAPGNVPVRDEDGVTIARGVDCGEDIGLRGRGGDPVGGENGAPGG
ncbi:MAG TPA: hypothetical protein VFH87_01775 [Candidatus Udaeobacter sp.]|nr:hypothetical protein [Candidatus Udaeobacter sp.]